MKDPVYKYTVEIQDLYSGIFVIDYFSNYLNDIEMSLFHMIDGRAFESNLEEYSLTIL